MELWVKECKTIIKQFANFAIVELYWITIYLCDVLFRYCINYRSGGKKWKKMKIYL